MKRGPNYDTTQYLQMDHLRHVFSLRAAGEQLITIPIKDEDSEIRSIGVFRSADRDGVAKLAAADPGVVAGRFTFEISRAWAYRATP